MQTTEEIKAKIKSTQDLRSVVKTMKSLAAVNIRQYEKAVEALEDYTKAVELGLQTAAGKQAALKGVGPESKGAPAAVVIIGSDLGMCGRLNEEVTSHFREMIPRIQSRGAKIYALVLGERITISLQETGFEAHLIHKTPGGVSGVRPLAQRLILDLDTIRADTGLGSVWVFYSERKGKASFEPVHKRLLPADHEWLEGLTRREWPGKTAPIFTMDPQQLLSDLLRHYLFAQLYRSITESLASENSARLMAMQRAEKNIGELLDELTAKYHQQRQMSVTQEILEVVAGFEALK